MDSDPRSEFISKIDLHKSHIVLQPPIILLFGGKMSEREDIQSSSVRHRIYNNIMVKSTKMLEDIRIVEHFPDWTHDAVYPNLLEFEEDLACAASLIVIVLEGHGASAELGAFSVNKKIQEKIMIIMESRHKRETSFITLGPLRLLNEENVLGYHYVTEHKGNDLDESVLKLIRDEIDKYLTNYDKKTKKFKSDNNAHEAFLIYELILRFIVLSISEIKKYLEKLNVEDISLSKIKKRVFLLEKLGLIDKNRVGSADLYFALCKESRVGFNVDNKNINILVMEYYEKHESYRLQALAGRET